MYQRCDLLVNYNYIQQDRTAHRTPTHPQQGGRVGGELCSKSVWQITFSCVKHFRSRVCQGQ